MSLPIYVNAYTGYKASERPRLFQVDDDLYQIVAVEDQWRTAEATFFKVRTTDDGRYVLRYDEEADEWTLTSDLDGARLIARPNIEVISVDSTTIREAESRIAGCERCRGDEAHVLFDWILADVLGKRGPLEFMLTAPAHCPVCRATITEKSWVEPQGGVEVNTTT